MTQLCFYFDQRRCTGCFTCAVACKDWHDIDAGPVNRMRVQVREEGDFPNIVISCLASPCYQCLNPPCVLACPAKAIVRRQADGIVTVDRGKCLGNKECRTLCLHSCPWAAPQFGPEENAKMQKCEFCFERLEQGKQAICVEACPMYALDLGPEDELRAKYGAVQEAVGFRYFPRYKPSVIFKLKK